MKTIKLFLAAVLILPLTLQAQRKKKKAVPEIVVQDSMFHGLKWRNIGPFRGGRSVASSGVIGQPMTYYMGATGGGVWKTEDGGVTWEILPNSIDYRFILDITVSVENDTSRLYVAASNEYYQGTSLGQQGVYKSSDGGTTFELTQSSTNSNIGAISDFEIS